MSSFTWRLTAALICSRNLNLPSVRTYSRFSAFWTMRPARVERNELYFPAAQRFTKEARFLPRKTPLGTSPLIGTQSRNSLESFYANITLATRTLKPWYFEYFAATDP